jgi:hypothetical protein
MFHCPGRAGFKLEVRLSRKKVDLHASVAEDTGSHQTSYGGDSRASSPGRRYVYPEPL